jgi:hypothetical protein
MRAGTWLYRLSVLVALCFVAFLAARAISRARMNPTGARLSAVPESSDGNEESSGEDSGAEADSTVEGDSLAALARKNLALEARYGGDLSYGRERPMSTLARIKHAVSVIAVTGPTR